MLSKTCTDWSGSSLPFVCHTTMMTSSKVIHFYISIKNFFDFANVLVSPRWRHRRSCQRISDLYSICLSAQAFKGGSCSKWNINMFHGVKKINALAVVFVITIQIKCICQTLFFKLKNVVDVLTPCSGKIENNSSVKHYSWF